MNEPVLFIFAPNYKIALRYAADNHIQPLHWRFVHAEQSLLGLPDKTRVIILFGDLHGDLDFSAERWKVRRAMFTLEETGRIKTFYRRTNEPPDLPEGNS